MVSYDKQKWKKHPQTDHTHIQRERERETEEENNFAK